MVGGVYRLAIRIVLLCAAEARDIFVRTLLPNASAVGQATARAETPGVAVARGVLGCNVLSGAAEAREEPDPAAFPDAAVAGEPTARAAPRDAATACEAPTRAVLLGAGAVRAPPA